MPDRRPFVLTLSAVRIWPYGTRGGGAADAVATIKKRGGRQSVHDDDGDGDDLTTGVGDLSAPDKITPEKLDSSIGAKRAPTSQRPPPPISNEFPTRRERSLGEERLSGGRGGLTCQALFGPDHAPLLARSLARFCPLQFLPFS